MKFPLPVQIGLALCVGVSAVHGQSTPSSQSLCDMPSQRGTAIYNKYCVGTATPASSVAPTQQQQMGLALGQAAMPLLQQAVHNLFYGAPKKTPQLQVPDPAQQQRELAARQLNDSGIYLLRQKNYAGAINEFEKALANTPNNPTILRNLALAREQMKGAAVAAQTSGALGQLLGNAPAGSGLFDFGPLTNSSIANPNASPLSLVNLGSDASVVDLRGTSSASPESLKSELDGLLTNRTQVPVPPVGQVVLPEARDIELLFDAVPPQAQSPNVPANVVNESNDVNTAKALAELDKVLDTKADQDLQRQLDWFNKVYLPAHPELLKAPPATPSTTPHN